MSKIFHVVVVDWPNNWTGHPSLLLNKVGYDQIAVLAIRLQKLTKKVGSVALLYRSDLNIPSEIQSVCESMHIPVFQVSARTSELQFLNCVSKDLQERDFIWKHVAEDVAEPTEYAISCSTKAVDEDYLFSVNEHTGQNFEIFRVGLVRSLIENNLDIQGPLKFHVAYEKYKDFKVRRFKRREVLNEGDVLRLTIDNQEKLDFFDEHVFQRQADFESATEEAAKGLSWMWQRLPAPWFDHRTKIQSMLAEPGIVQFLERGLMFKHLIPETGSHVDICSGSMTLPEFVYSQGSAEVVCVEEGEFAKEIYQNRALHAKGIHLHEGSVLHKSCWKNLQDRFPNGVESVSWTAAIEHFTREQQHFILRNVHALPVCQPLAEPSDFDIT